jgi:hypothetical protein
LPARCLPVAAQESHAYGCLPTSLLCLCLSVLPTLCPRFSVFFILLFFIFIKRVCSPLLPDAVPNPPHPRALLPCTRSPKKVTTSDEQSLDQGFTYLKLYKAGAAAACCGGCAHTCLPVVGAALTPAFAHTCVAAPFWAPAGLACAAAACARTCLC